jgi:hypothetical protein
VAGIDRAPQKVAKSMSKKKIVKRSKCKPFLKYVNYQHIMPTRYSVGDIELRNVVTPAAMKKADTKVTYRCNFLSRLSLACPSTPHILRSSAQPMRFSRKLLRSSTLTHARYASTDPFSISRTHTHTFTQVEAKKEVKKAFEGRYINRGKNSSGVQYFFHKLRF